jgi:Ca2+-binding RTX toxin-like protein
LITSAGLNSDDVIKGENGTDVLKISGDAALTDAKFKNVSSIETVKIDAMAGAATSTFAANAQSAGVTKIDSSAIIADAGNKYNINASAFTSAVALTITGSKADMDKGLVGGGGADTINSGANGATTYTGGAGVDLFNHTSVHVNGHSITDLSGTDNFTVSASAKDLVATVSADYVAGTTTQNQAAREEATLETAGFDVSLASVTAGTSGFIITNSSTAATLQGSGLGDSITGAAAADSIVGNGGADLLVGKANSDTVSGGGGNDTIVVSTTEQLATDSIDGGSGTDNIEIRNGTAAWTGEFDMDVISNVLAFATSGAGAGGADATVTFSDIAETTSQVVTLTGATLTNATGDLIIVNSADSATTTFSITGGSGADALIGSNGADTLTGGAAADTLTGGLGGDSLVGGAGKDQAVMGAGGTVTHTGAVVSGTTDISSGLDILTGFSTAEDDTLNFSAFENVTIADAAVSDGTTLHDGTANQVNLVSGIFNEATGVFTTGAYSGSNNDTLLQVAGGASTTTINNFMLLNSGALATITFSSEIGTLA